MPWDETELWVARIKDDGSLDLREKVAGGNQESIFHPQWSPRGELYFVSDRTGWWNLHRLNKANSVEPVVEAEAEFGIPQWVFGMSTYAFESAERIVCSYVEKSIWRVGIIDTGMPRLLVWQDPPQQLTELVPVNGALRFNIRTGNRISERGALIMSYLRILDSIRSLGQYTNRRFNKTIIQLLW